MSLLDSGAIVHSQTTIGGGIYTHSSYTVAAVQSNAEIQAVSKVINTVSASADTMRPAPVPGFTLSCWTAADALKPGSSDRSEAPSLSLKAE